MAKQLIPDTFNPMFPTARIDTSLDNKCFIRGKYLLTQHRDGVHLDLSNMELVEETDEFPFDPNFSKSWTLPRAFKRGDQTLYCVYFNEYSGKLLSKQRLKVLHESERWLLVRDYEARDDEKGEPFVPVRLVDKKAAVDDVIEYDEKNTITFPAGYKDTYILHFLENTSAILQIVYDFQACTSDIYVMFFDDQGSFTEPVFLASFKDAILEKLKETGKRESHYDEIHERGHHRTESLVYAGMLYFSNYNRELIPLWVDFELEKPFSGSKFSWHTLRLKPYGTGSGFIQQDPYPLIRNGRWVALRQSEGRSVCDLLTFKTYFVRDGGWREELSGKRKQKYGTAGACLNGIDSDDKPIFYIIPKHVLWFMHWELNRDKRYTKYWNEWEGEFMTKRNDKPVKPHNPELFLGDCQGVFFNDDFFELDMSGDYNERIVPVKDQEQKDWKLPGEVMECKLEDEFQGCD